MLQIWGGIRMKWLKKQYKKVIILFGTVCMCIILLVIFRTKSITEYTTDSSSFEHFPTYAKGISSGIGSIDFCTTESGLFYTNNHLLRFYDFESKKKYILCAENNCVHNSASCSAWYEKEGDMEGIAVHNEKVYAFIRNEKENTYDFTEMNMMAKQRKVLATVPIGNYEKGEWFLQGFGDSYYCGDMVWVTLRLSCLYDAEYDIYKEQCIGIHLDTGEKIFLNELEKTLLNEKCSIACVGEEKIVLAFEKYAQDILTQEEFSTAYQNTPENFVIGPFEWEEKYLEDEEKEMIRYERYLEYQKKNYEYYSYALDTQEMKHLMTTEAYEEFLEDGSLNLRMGHYKFRGWVDGMLLVTDYQHEGKGSTTYIMNETTGELTKLFEVYDGGILSIREGFARDIIFCEDISEKVGEIYRFNFDTKEKELLFEDIPTISFRFESETSQYYIGYIDKGRKLCRIKKEDYYAGKFENMVQISIW